MYNICQRIDTTGYELDINPYLCKLFKFHIVLKNDDCMIGVNDDTGELDWSDALFRYPYSSLYGLRNTSDELRDNETYTGNLW